MLQHSKRGRIGARHHETCQQSCFAKRRMEKLENARPLQRSISLLLFPDGRFGQKRADQNQRNSRKKSRYGRVTPRLVTSMDRGQAMTIRYGEIISTADQQPARGCECLRISDHSFPSLPFRKKLGKPGGGRNKFDRDTDESPTAEDQHLQGGARIGRGKSGKAEQQYAPEQHAAAAQSIDQIPAEQTEDAPSDGGDIKEHADPMIEDRTARFGGEQLAQSRPDNQRQHQEFVRVERKS